MKKVLALLLALVLVLSLAACGGGSSSNVESSSVESQEETEKEITADSLIGVWVRDTFDTDLVAIQLLKGGIAKSQINSEPPFDWSNNMFNDTWELKDGYIHLDKSFSETVFHYSFEIIDENTIQQVDNGNKFKRQ